MAESDKTDQPRPGDVSADKGPGELEDLEAADADVQGGGGQAGIDPTDARSRQ